MIDVITIDELQSSQHWFRKIDVGTRISIQLLDQKQTRMRAELLGFRIGQYIILRYEEDNSTPVSLIGYSAVVRFLVEDLVGECLAFKTEIKHSVRQPDRIIFLTFPDEIHHRPLRNQQRASTEIPAVIRLRDKESSPSYHGNIVDISSGGCRFVFGEEARNKEVKQLPVVISIGGDKRIIPGEIRSSKLEGEQLTIGVKFNEAQNDLEHGPSGLISELEKQQS
ncbi:MULTISPECIES: PilZ domain-containing protein [Gammaproteobacteria]|uniref:PilZ domain-containing protein n=1 Tax=Gammaproteobacteria TaxID=1236 RepID=UPI000DCFA213|nr:MULTISPECIES: PilZ domain-containing protein [Gammaproteobacteria]RTE86488.1 flagellar brake protein [Aliidiomarina sp. B3213]TCZ90957.1 flagellar brake protein [Lysobacter sp. N42]